MREVTEALARQTRPFASTMRVEQPVVDDCQYLRALARVDLSGVKAFNHQHGVDDFVGLLTVKVGFHQVARVAPAVAEPHANLVSTSCTTRLERRNHAGSLARPFASEAAWPRPGSSLRQQDGEVAADSLNDRLAVEAAQHGWTLVHSHVNRFWGHAICSPAPENWVNTHLQSLRAQGELDSTEGLPVPVAVGGGIAHPNREGYRQIGIALAGDMRPVVVQRYTAVSAPVTQAVARPTGFTIVADDPDRIPSRPISGYWHRYELRAPAERHRRDRGRRRPGRSARSRVRRVVSHVQPHRPLPRDDADVWAVVARRIARLRTHEH